MSQEFSLTDELVIRAFPGSVGVHSRGPRGGEWGHITFTDPMIIQEWVRELDHFLDYSNTLNKYSSHVTLANSEGEVQMGNSHWKKKDERATLTLLGPRGGYKTCAYLTGEEIKNLRDTLASSIQVAFPSQESKAEALLK